VTKDLAHLYVPHSGEIPVATRPSEEWLLHCQHPKCTILGQLNICIFGE
jgi:hypothetical protein